MDAGLIIAFVLPGIGLLQAGLMLVHAWEHRRYHARRWASRVKPTAELSVALVAPCKGLDPDLAANLLALFRQWYPRYELCFVVESESDPAIPVIHNLARENPQVPSRIVIAGLAHDCGQKVHNLMKAVEAILDENRDGTRPPLPPLPKGGNSSGRPDVLAFVDSDACPHTEWLARLVERLESGKHAVSTGYRWYLPADRRLKKGTVHPDSIDAGVNCDRKRPPQPPQTKEGD
jgi:cellulose synthase/poly-beta-1,6-N-acetylglucosamine synthase-like glycosyltransferase